MTRWVLVTGGARRLGRAAAEHLSAEGWGVVIHYNTGAEDAEQLVTALTDRGAEARACGADLATPEAAAGLAARAALAAGAPITAVVNAAAVFEHDLIETLDPALFMRQMSVNALAPCLVTQGFAGQLPGDARGAVVNFLDFKLVQPYPDHFSYTLSKYALSGATLMLARALAPRVRVNAVAPGYVLPAPGQSETDYARIHAMTPLERGVRPEDIARAVSFLLSSEAVTGQTILVDSGAHFRPMERDFAFL